MLAPTLYLASTLAFLSALTFAASNTMLRRGVMTGTVAQAVAVTVPLGALTGWLGLGLTGSIWSLEPSKNLVLYSSLAGVIHFVAGRYCHYRAMQAMGANLVAPVQQTSVVITLVLAIVILGEAPTVVQTIGIVIVLVSPLFLINRSKPAKPGSIGCFRPDLRSGYAFASLSAVAFGVSPIFISFGLRESSGVMDGLTAGTLAYTAATIVVLAIFAFSRHGIVGLFANRSSIGWYAVTGVAVGVSQLFIYMALAIAPVSVVVPIQRTSIMMRFGLAGVFNRDAEVFGARMLLATVLSVCGAVAIAIDPSQIGALAQRLFGES